MLSCELQTTHLLKGKCRENVNSGASWVYKLQKIFDVLIPVADNLSRFSGASSYPLSLLIRYSGSDTAKFYPGGGSGRAAPG